MSGGVTVLKHYFSWKLIFPFLVIGTIYIFYRRRKKYRAESHASGDEFTEIDELLEECEHFWKNRDSYLSHSDFIAWKTKYRSALAKSSTYSRFLGENSKKLSRIRKSLKEFETKRKRYNEEFIHNELVKYQDFFETFEKNPLDEEQRRAVVTNEDRTLVVAGAGSGKTTVIAAKVAYLVQHRGIDPNKILLLTFTKKATKELQERIKNKVGVQIDANTFHSFGLKLVKRIQPQFKLSRDLFQGSGRLRSIVENLVYSSDNFASQVLRFLSEYSSPVPLDEAFHQLDEKVPTNRRNPKTILGEQVRSHEEKRIADFLFKNGIKYSYEKPFVSPTTGEAIPEYRPDFFLDDYGIYWEHFGINKNGNVAKWFTGANAREKYHEGMKWKIELHAEHQSKLIQTFSYLAHGNNFEATMTKILAENKIIAKPVQRERLASQLMQTIEENRFLDLLWTFTCQFKYQEIKILSLPKQISLLFSNKYTRQRATSFVEIFRSVESQHRSVQENEGYDFQDMIVLAKNLIFDKPELAALDYDYIIVDEFQDADPALMKLIEAVQLSKPHCRLFCVGDDWQSIYGFKGSDLKIFEELNAGNEGTISVQITKNYRSFPHIVELGKWFIEKNPRQIRKKVTSGLAIDPLIAAKYPFDFINWQQMAECLNEIIQNNSSENIKIFLLGRYTSDYPDDIFAQLVTAGGHTHIEFSTIHGSKGLEADYVFILPPANKSAEFPSVYEDDPVMNLVMPKRDNYEFAEERRLMYVAITRAKKQVFFVLRGQKYDANESIFYREIYEYLDNLHQDDRSPMSMDN